MKKRGRIVLTALCLLLTLAGRAETGAPETYDAVIASSCVTDRIAVRTGPDAEADSPVLLYCGVPVRVLEEQGDWACVEAGGDGAVIRQKEGVRVLMLRNEHTEDGTLAITDSGKYVLAWDATRSFDYQKNVATDTVISNW